MPRAGARPQRKAAAAAREKLAQGGGTTTRTGDKPQQQEATPAPAKPAQPQQQAPPAAAAGGRRTQPLGEGARAKPADMKKEEGQAEKDKHTQEKKDDNDSTAPLPEKVCGKA